ncbi:hypothetical protein VJI72_04820 [Parvimonas micra]|uniref:hypothetical protein n=1 Tax=Parvimonas micra TaxID=33033 RepID=UPI002B4617DF|nr:hypothetical protein [Parvimonas micra]MEB3029113.1 hypothetical protein [Parvimonas micra]
MIIISEDERNIIFLEREKIRNINIHSSKKKIMASYFDPVSRDIILGEYDSSKKCERAFGLLIVALENQKDFFRMIKNDDNTLNTQLFQNGKSKRTHYEMIGKTK